MSVAADDGASDECPSDGVLARFIEGQLHGDTLSTLEAHIDRCEACMVLVAELTGDGDASSHDVSLPDPDRDPGSGQTPRAVGARLGRYIVLEPIGAGGMGVVYAGYDPQIDRKVALKLVRVAAGAADEHEQRKRLVREARAMGQLAHPNVVAVHDVGESGDDVFVAMEFIDGQTLGQWLGQQPRRWPQILAVFGQAGRGLAAAHDQGLVHRDFKPSNVLVGSDGRVRVLDFGLARVGAMASDREDAWAEARAAESSTVTRTGAVLGTPAYMSPEQYLGHPADARSDQYSFCVALHEALFGERPIEGRSFDSLAAKVVAGKVRTVGGSVVPAWLRRGLMRGLARDPTERWTDMHALLRALDPAPHRRRRLAALGGVGGGIVLGSMMLWRPATPPSPGCEGARQHLVGVWDSAVEQGARQAFEATQAPYQADMWRTTKQQLDDYTRGWVEARVEVCEATHVRHEQSARLLDLRMGCLDRAMRETETVVELLAQADDDVVARAAGLVSGLPRLERCTTLDGQRADALRPDDPAQVPEVEQLYDDIGRAGVLGRAGRHAEAQELLRATIAASDELGFDPARARARQQAGRLHNAAGEQEQAESMVSEAYWIARRIDDLPVIVETETLLVFIAGHRGQRFEEARRWAEHARVDIQRVGNDPILQLELEKNVGVTLVAQGRYMEALGHLEAALALSRRELGEHPTTAQAHNNLAIAHSQRGFHREAIEQLELALALHERFLGPRHPQVADVLNNEGLAYLGLRQPEQAQARLLRALEIRLATVGPDSTRTAEVNTNLGVAYFQKQQLELAERAFADAHRSYERVYGPDHSYVATSLFNRGDVASAREDFAEAIALYERALSIFEAVLGADHPGLAELLMMMARAERGLGRRDAALARLSRAAILCGSPESNAPDICARARFTQAELQFEQPDQRAQAIEAVRQSLETLRHARPDDPERALMERWLEQHDPR